MAEQNMSKFAYFINTTPSATAPTYKRLGSGVITAKMAYGPQKTTETYINEDTAHTTVDSYQPNLPITMKVYPGDSVFNFIDAIRTANAGPSIGGNDLTQLVEVQLYGTPNTAGTSYPAVRWNVAVSIENAGGDGGKKAEVDFQLNILGAQTKGMFNTSTLAFS